MFSLSSKNARPLALVISIAVHASALGVIAKRRVEPAIDAASDVPVDVEISTVQARSIAPVSAASTISEALPSPSRLNSLTHDGRWPASMAGEGEAVEKASDASKIPADASSVPHFSIVVGGDAPAHDRTVALTNATSARDRAETQAIGRAREVPVDESGVTSAARLVRGVTPSYPIAAREHEIEADVPLEIVVDRSGVVIWARVEKYAGYGLDESALNAIRQYRFSPAVRGASVVVVRMHWVVQFRLQ